MRQVHKVALLAGAVVIAAIAVAAVLFLNNWSSGASASEKQAQVEHDIKAALERRAARAGKGAKVHRVRCVRSDESHYECLASAEIRGEVVSVPVSVISDDKRFIWKVGESGETPTADSSGNRLPPTESLAWTQITCEEVNRAAAERDYRWMARAGEAVAVQAVATQPNADAERLATTGARDLVTACRQASNPSYQPYVAANIALLTGRGP